MKRYYSRRLLRYFRYKLRHARGREGIMHCTTLIDIQTVEYHTRIPPRQQAGASTRALT